MAASSFPCNPTALRPLPCTKTYALMTYITIMKRRDLCKTDSAYSLQSEISSRYHREAVRFQHIHNSAHPGDRIWRHMLCKRVFHFLRGGVLLTVEVEMVRFIYVNTGRTFTFYGTLFLPRTRYSKEFIRAAISLPGSESSLCVSADTVRRWKKAYAPSIPTQDHNRAPRPALPGMV